MEEGKNKLCPLCGRAQCTIIKHQLGWYDLFCDNCFKYKLYDNVWERGLNGKPRDNSKEFTKELRKRWNAIYNFLLYNPHYKENEFKQIHYWFAFFTKGKPLLPFEIEMDILLTDYPKTMNEKLNRILLNIYKKNGTESFSARDFDDGLIFCEGDNRTNEADYWYHALIDTGYLKSQGFGAAQLTFPGVQKAEQLMSKREEENKRLNAKIMLEKMKNIIGLQTDYQSDVIFEYNQTFGKQLGKHNHGNIQGVAIGGHDSELKEIIVKLEGYLKSEIAPVVISEYRQAGANQTTNNIINFHSGASGVNIQQGTTNSAQTISSVVNDVELLITEIKKEINSYGINKEQREELLEMVQDIEKAVKEKKPSKLKALLFGVGNVLKDITIGVTAGIIANKL